jgi:hypothetical protein
VLLSVFLLFHRMVWYCTKNFFVKGGTELRKLDNIEFMLVHDSFGNEILR